MCSQVTINNCVSTYPLKSGYLVNELEVDGYGGRELPLKNRNYENFFI